MSFEEFCEATKAGNAAPAGLTGPLLALWQDARGEWDAAHATVQADRGVAGAWVHAYLHRKAGDLGNAGYWYHRAGRSAPDSDVESEAEWAEVARELLARPGVS